MKKKKLIIIIVALILIVPFFYYSYTFSRYVASSVWNNYLQSKGFYFESDYLGDDAPVNINKNWNGSSIYLNVRNNHNNTLITDYDIKFTAECTIEGEASNHASCFMNGSNNNEYEGTLSAYEGCYNNKNDAVDVSGYNKSNCELYGYSWQNVIATNELYFDIVLTNQAYELDTVTAKIEVTSTSPYKKTIDGIFELTKIPNIDNQLLFEYTDYDTYGRLLLTNTYSSNKCIGVKWSTDKLLIGEDKENLEHYGVNPGGYINEFKALLNSKENKNYIFYKKDTDLTYNIDDFIITEEVCE